MNESARGIDTSSAGEERRYVAVAKALRQQIVDGEYAIGARLPTERDLADRFAVSRETSRRLAAAA